MKKTIYALCFVGAIIYSCTTKTVATTTASSNTSEAYVTKGKTVFDESCGRCHGLPDASDHTAEQWSKIIARMAPKAKLNADETNWVLAYVTVNAKK